MGRKMFIQKPFFKVTNLNKKGFKITGPINC